MAIVHIFYHGVQAARAAAMAGFATGTIAVTAPMAAVNHLEKNHQDATQAPTTEHVTAALMDTMHPDGRDKVSGNNKPTSFHDLTYTEQGWWRATRKRCHQEWMSSGLAGLDKRYEFNSECYKEVSQSDKRHEWSF